MMYEAMLKEMGDMHEWWCEDKEDEPLCEVWEEYRGDHTQYHKIPKDKIPKPERIAAMHEEYCALKKNKEKVHRYYLLICVFQ